MPVRTVKSISDEAYAGRPVLVRADFNVPFDARGAISDDARIVRTIPTLTYLLERGARVIVMSHLGRPKGTSDPAFSLEPVSRHLAGLLSFPVRFSPELVGPSVSEAVAGLGKGELLLLENTRFHPGETKNDGELSAALARLGEVFVNDAFGTAHRAHASTVGVAEALRARGGRAVAGLLMESEIRYLSLVLETPEHPFVGILGGAKISGKIDVIRSLMPRVDRLLIGGAMANTFFRALGLETGKSLLEEDRVELALELLEEGGEKIVLPVDCMVAAELTSEAEARAVERGSVGASDRIGDIGPATREVFASVLKGARTVVWNGPMGVFEFPPFRRGTTGVAHAVAGVTEAGGTTVVGGGDSVAAAKEAGVADRLTHVSTGGGASLEFLAGRELPGVAVLEKAEEGEER